MRDRVLRDLHDDRLPVLEHALDLGLAAAVDVAGVERDVAAVEHAVLRRADVDERGLHAGQDVLDATEVDVAVDRFVAGWRGERVLDQVAAFEHGDVGVAALEHVHAHEVPAGGTSLAGAAAPALEDVVVEIGGGQLAHAQVGADDVVDGARAIGASSRHRRGAPAPAPAPFPAAPAPPRPRPRPPRRRRRFFSGSGVDPFEPAVAAPRSPASSVCAGAGRVSPTRGRASAGGAASAGTAAGGRRSPICGIGEAGGSPASSRATSATSSVVRPRSAAASV